jgi:peptidoglycan hydrolase CwlO-like protein
MAMNPSVAMDLFPYLMSALGGLITIFVGVLIHGQAKLQDTLSNQNEQLTRIAQTLETVIEDRLPKLDRKVDELDKQLDGVDIRLATIETKISIT